MEGIVDKVIVDVGKARAAVGMCALMLLAFVASGLLPGSAAAMPADELEKTVGQLEVTASERWPDTFAGLWIQRGDPKNGVYVAFTEKADLRVQELANMDIYPNSSDLLPVTRKYSVQHLDNLLTQVVADRDHAQLGEGKFASVAQGYYLVGVNPKSSEVYINFEGASAEEQKLFSGQYGEAVTVYDVPAPRPLCVSRQNCGVSLRGGIEVYGNLYTCTSAFRVWTGAGHQLLSAGHCSSSLNESRYHGTSSPFFFGRVKGRKMAQQVDVERISVGNGFTAYARVYRTNTDVNALVESQSSYSSMPIGKRICKLGTTTGRTCGKVLAKNVSVPYIPGSYGFVDTDFCVRGGDSGGSVIAGTQAVGIVSGGNETSCGTSPRSDMVFGHIEHALNAMGVILSTSS